MKAIFKLTTSLSILSLVGVFLCCDDPPVPYEGIAGRVIKIEYCTSDTLCIVVSDIPYPSNKRQYNDTLTVDGKVYTGVLKTYDLPLRYHAINKKLDIGFEVVETNAKICTTDLANKITEMKILNVAATDYKL